MGKPCVWSLVPDRAEILRPILLPHVTDEIFGEICLASVKEHVTLNEFARWVRLASPKAVQLNAAHTPSVFSAAIFERCATIIEAALHNAWKEYKAKEALREYGQQTWEAGHEGETQRLHDVGMYRYAVSSYGRSFQGTPRSSGEPVEQPSAVKDMVSNMSAQMQEAMGTLSLDTCRNPTNLADDWKNDNENGMIDCSEKLQHRTAPPTEYRKLVPDPHVLPVPATSSPSPLSALPATACDLTRPRGFSEFQTSVF